MNRHRKILDHLATCASHYPGAGGHRLAAALVRRNKIVSFGVNMNKSDPFQTPFRKNEHAAYLHAEIGAIKALLSRYRGREESIEFSKMSLYVARCKWDDHSKQNLGWGLAQPCIGCQDAIKKYGIRRVYYTMNDPDKKQYTRIKLNVQSLVVISP